MSTFNDSKYMLVKRKPDGATWVNYHSFATDDKELSDHISAMFAMTDHELISVVRLAP